MKLGSLCFGRVLRGQMLPPVPGSFKSIPCRDDGSRHACEKCVSGDAGAPTSLVTVNGKGIEATPDEHQVKSPETYVGSERAQNFQGGAPLVKDHPAPYSADLAAPGTTGTGTRGVNRITFAAGSQLNQ